jgi:DNA-binding XRE family transcriptional regulator
MLVHFTSCTTWRQQPLYLRRVVSSVPGVPLPAETDPDLAHVLRTLREQRGRSQEALAHDAGLTLRTLQRIERAQANPTWFTVRQIARALGVPLTEIANAIDERSTASQ